LGLRPEGGDPGLDPGVAVNAQSYTGQYVKQVFDRRSGAKAAKRRRRRSNNGLRVTFMMIGIVLEWVTVI
jgi:hypothetical protein